MPTMFEGYPWSMPTMFEGYSWSMPTLPCVVNIHLEGYSWSMPTLRCVVNIHLEGYSWSMPTLPCVVNIHLEGYSWYTPTMCGQHPSRGLPLVYAYHVWGLPLVHAYHMIVFQAIMCIGIYTTCIAAAFSAIFSAASLLLIHAGYSHIHIDNTKNCQSKI